MSTRTQLKYTYQDRLNIPSNLTYITQTGQPNNGVSPAEGYPLPPVLEIQLSARPRFSGRGHQLSCLNNIMLMMVASQIGGRMRPGRCAQRSKRTAEIATLNATIHIIVIGGIRLRLDIAICGMGQLMIRMHVTAAGAAAHAAGCAVGAVQMRTIHREIIFGGGVQAGRIR